MRKEVFFAILVGLIMGLFITYGVYHSQKASENNQTTANIEELEAIAPTPDPQKNGKITLYYPEDETVLEQTSTQVTGKTTPNVFVVIFVNNEPIITQADATGNFAKEVKLETLANIIKVHSIDEDGEHNVIERTVVVYDQDLTAETNQDATGEVAITE